MSVSSFTYKFMILSALALNVKASRKYDIDTEAIKLYGEDLKAVLQKFRRSPEYLQILQDRKDVVLTIMGDQIQNVESQFKVLLEKKIKQIHNNKDSKYKLRMPQVSKKNLGYYRMPRLSGRRNDEKENNKTNVELLDAHVLEMLSVDYNKYRQLAFEYAGNAIHTILKSMGSDQIEEKSTQLPYADNLPTTTEHVLIHTVETTIPPIEDEIESVTDFVTDTTLPAELRYHQQHHGKK